MNREEFIKQVRKGGKLHIGSVQINTKDRIIKGEGTLQSIDGKFEICIILEEGVEPPDILTGKFLKEDYWKMEGVIENSLHFHIPLLQRSYAKQYKNGINTVNFHSQSFELGANLNKLVDEDESLKNPIEFRGLLLGFSLIDKTSNENELFGDVETDPSITGTLDDSFEFGLRQKDDDVEFIFRSRKDYKSNGESDDNHCFHAFTSALSFMHGKNAWPFILTYQRNEELLMDRISAFVILNKTGHTPFNEKIWIMARLSNSSWNFVSTFTKVYQFFLKKTPLSEAISNLLFSFRESTSKGVHTRVVNIALCAFLENLILAIEKNQNLDKNLDETLEENAFDLTRDEILSFIKREERSSNSEQKRAYKRFRGSIKGLKFWYKQNRWKRVFDHLGLAWNQWGEIYQLWDSHRHIIMHEGKLINDEYEKDIEVETKIAGMINVIILKLMGYSGLARVSTYDDKYQQI